MAKLIGGAQPVPLPEIPDGKDVVQGDYVRIHEEAGVRGVRGVVFLVEEDNHKGKGHYLLAPVGGGKKVLLDGSFGLIKVAKPANADAPVVEINPGTVVRLVNPGPRWKSPADMLWVVTKIEVNGGLTVVPLGGGTLVGKTSRTNVEIIPLDRITVS